MRYSTLFPKTLRDSPSEANNISTKLLYQAGFIRESTAGRYYFLPLGLRVHHKIIQLMREEMNRTGAQEMVTPILHPLELWQETNRTNSAGFELMQVKDRRSAKFALGGTAEEMFVDLVRRNPVSYRDMPFNLYQFSPKFRDEMRARGGLLRVREFTMKDAYSFDRTEEDFKVEYLKMWNTYKKIFDRLGLPTVVVESDNGYIGGEYCHEFVVESEVGESRFLMTPDGSYAAHEDVAKFTHEMVNPDDKVEDFKIIDQPKWVQTMEHNEKHYKLPAKRFLKNVVYKTTDGRIIIGTIRGDLEVNPTKLAHAVNAVGGLEPATDEDLAKLGTKSGYVHCWGHKGCTYVGDLSLKTVRNFIGGQKEDLTDSFNVNYGRDFTCEVEADIAMAQPGMLAPNGKDCLVEKRGIEVGNIFQLGYHYSKLMDANFVDEDGTRKLFYMGCYGIGVGRTLATIVEKFNDDKGLIWPREVAPFQVHLVVLPGDPAVKEAANALYKTLLEQDIEVLYDDRDGVSAGVKFADADLIGLPWRFLIGKKTVASESVEIKARTAKETELVKLTDLSAWCAKNI